MPQLIAERVRELRGTKSRATIVYKMARAGYELTEGGLKMIETVPGRIPHATTIEGLAKVFEVPPESFYEYPIAVERRAATAAEAEAALEADLVQEAQPSGERAASSDGAIRPSDDRAEAASRPPRTRKRRGSSRS